MSKYALCDVVGLIFVRIVLIVHNILAVWRTASVKGDSYWLLALCNLAIVLEGVIRLVFYKAKEGKW